MANALIPIDQAATAISPLMRARMQQNMASNSNFSDGLRDAYPVLSVKGKVFRVRQGGAETPFLDPATRQPIAFMDVVLVNASPNLAKSYYVKGFTDGEMEAPDCWSMDSIRPDPSVAKKMNPVCGSCPMNAFGSRKTEAGKDAKACSDARRVAVVMPHQLDGAEQMLMLLRIAQTSLKNLKAYADLLARHQMEPAGVITRLTFDYQEAYPKLMFDFVQPLSEAQYIKAIELIDAPNTKAMLMAPDFDDAPSPASAHQDALAASAAGTAQGSMQGQPASAGPVVGTAQDNAAAMLAATMAAAAAAASASAPVVQAGTLAARLPGAIVEEDNSWMPAGAIILPDGKIFNPTTGQFIVKPEPKVEPVAAKDPMEGLITLPDGKIFNPATGQYVEMTIAAKIPETPAPVIDTNTLKLPDGSYFNPIVGGYVTGPYVGDAKVDAVQAKAPVVGEVTPPVKPKRQRKAAAEGATIDGTANDAETGDIKPGVSAAPASLEELLGQLVPPS